MQKTINKFKSVIESCQGLKPNIMQLSMELQGKLCAPVSGGLDKYQSAFLSDAFIHSEEGKLQLQHIRRLNDLMLGLVPILKEALEIHTRLTNEIDLNACLNKGLIKMEENLRKSTISLPKMNRLLPDVPFEMYDNKMNYDKKTVPPLPIRHPYRGSIGKSSGNSFNDFMQNIILWPGLSGSSDRLSYTSSTCNERQEEMYENMQIVRSSSNTHSSYFYIK